MLAMVLFIIINALARYTRALKHPGLIAGVFGIGYAVSRTFVEFFRLPDAQIGYLYGGWLTMGMVLSVPILVAGIGLVIFALRPSRGE
jgi:phosphatidylglycerol:prolipoprotein diacylglycerol transferase